MKKQPSLSRRDFLKRFGITTASAAAMTAMGPISALAQETNAPVNANANAKMTRRKNPNTKDKVSLLGYGMMRMPERDHQIDQEMVNAEVDYALAHGVNYFDTAPVYSGGRNEGATGKALSRHPRDSYFVATKLSNFGEERSTDPARSLEKAKEMYRNSMKELQVDYIDYYLLHSVGGEEAFQKRFVVDGVMDFLLEERKAGRIRNLGFSFHGNGEGIDYMMSQHEKYHWDFVQIQMNYLEWQNAGTVNRGATNAEYLYNAITAKKIPVVVMEPLLGGRLTKLPTSYAEQLRALRPDDSMAAWAFRFVGSRPGVMTVLSGMTKMEHLEENVRTFSPLQALSSKEEEALQGIAELTAKYPLVPCTACAYCMPCEQGVDIPGNFAAYNQGVNDGLLSDPAKFMELYRSRLDAEAFSTKCTGCRKCLEKCPQHIRIPSQLNRITRIIKEQA